MSIDDMRAAPPDDGGHHGSFTRPDETLVVGGTGDGGVAPPLHRDTTAGRSPWHMTWDVAVLLAVTVAVALLLGLPYAP